ncbi:hypothetical protein HK102_009571 [Quaeritorhiza haematococci]|nr:hypothetical protein HK102_009571 [Quaeritorhiza haematococci]
MYCGVHKRNLRVNLFNIPQWQQHKPIWLFSGVYGLTSSIITAVLYFFVSKKLHEITKTMRKEQQKQQQEELTSPVPDTAHGKSFVGDVRSSGGVGLVNPQASYATFSDVTWKLMAHTAVVIIAAFPLFCHAITIELFDVDPYIPSLIMVICNNSPGGLNLLVYLIFYRKKARMQLVSSQIRGSSSSQFVQMGDGDPYPVMTA